MSYERALVGRWGRRDRLAVVAVAATVALLTGATVLATSATAGAAALAGAYDPAAAAVWHDSVADAAAAVPDGGVVVPVARTTGPDGESRYVAGVPTAADRFADETGVALEPPAGTATGGGATAPAVATVGRSPVRPGETVTLEGARGTATVAVRERNRSALPPSWFVARPRVAERLGPTGAVVLAPASGPVPASGAPLPGGLAFVVAGGRRTVAGLWLLAGVAALLSAVTVRGTVRATVRDRRATVGVLLATGGSRRRLLGLFALRGGALAAAGAALGYALGVVAVHAAENAAAVAGVATALDVRVGPRAAGFVGASLLGVVAVGAVAGALAARPAVAGPPARALGAGGRSAGPDAVGGPDRRLADALAPRLLDRRALVPTAVGVAAFSAVVLLVAAGAGAAGPLLAGDGATVASPGAATPLESSVPAAYADALAARGTPASAEILLLATVDGRPVLARGARFVDFAAVSGATVRRGRAPAAPDEAVVGRDLARRLGVGVGDVLVLGGPARPALARVHVVGTFRAPGAADDQLVVSLPTARHLAGRPPGTVQFVRTAEPVDGDDAGAVAVVGLATPATAVANGTIRATVTLVNPGPSARTRAVRVAAGDASVTRSVRVPAGDRRRTTVELPAGPPGNRTVRAGDAARTVRVLPAGAPRIRGLPATAPPGSAPRIVVVDPRGRPLRGAAVTAAGWTARTDGEGAVRVPLSTPGNVTVEARHAGHGAAASVRVAPGVRRAPAADLRVSPATPTPLDRPVVAVALRNPWNRTLDRRVTVAGPDAAATRRVRLRAGDGRTVRVRLRRQPPGRYRVEVRSGGRSLATAAYAVRGGDRLVAAAATRGGLARRTGVGRAAAAAAGDLRLLAATVAVLAGLAALGATAATFAAGVRSARRTIAVRRATGATRAGVLAAVLADAVRVGLPAAVAGVLAAAVGVRAAGPVVVYGVAVSPRPGLPALLALVGAGTLLAVLGAGLAAAALLRRPPGDLLAGPASTRGVAASRGGDARG